MEFSKWSEKNLTQLAFAKLLAIVSNAIGNCDEEEPAVTIALLSGTSLDALTVTLCISGTVDRW